MFFYNESDNEVSYQVPVVSDPYFYNTSLLLKMDSDFSDSSVHQHAATTSGNVSVNNSEFKYGGGSGYFDGGTNTGLRIQSSGLLDLRNADWTVEAWINPDGNYDDHRMIMSKRNYSGTTDYHFYLSQSTGGLTFYNGITGFGTGVTPPANQWTHFAAVRKDGVITIYVNGEAKASQTLDIVNHNNIPLGIGNIGDLNRHPFRGYIDDVRITKGVARYTANFTPPDSHPTIGPSEIVSTDLQLHLDAGDTNSYSGTGTTWYDLSGNGNDGQINGPTYDSSNGGVFHFDGVSGGVEIPRNHLYQTGDKISAEAWINADNISDKASQAFFTIGGDPLVPRDRIFQMRITIYNGTPGYVDALYRDNANTAWQILKTTSVPIASSNWYHVVSTYTYGNGSSWKIYVNGVAQSTVFHSGNGNANPIQPADPSIYIGLGEDGGSGEPWLGKIGKVSLYHKTLTAAEVLQNFEVTKSRFGL